MDFWNSRKIVRRRHMIFDMSAIPETYFPFYEECVNMNPEIELRSWDARLRKIKRRFLV